MSPFDQNIDYDAGHTIDPAIDQDDLIAFHLHELTPSQERALHRVLHTSPTLQTESVAIANTLRAFPKHEAALPLDTAALDRHWQTLRPSLVPHILPARAPRSLFPRGLLARSPFPRWGLPALAGSALVTTVFLVALHYGHQTSPISHTLVATTQSPTSTPSALAPPTPSNPAFTNPAPSSSSPFTASTPYPSTIDQPSPPASAPPIFASKTPVPPTSTNPATAAKPNPAGDIPIAPSQAYPPAQSPAQRPPSSPIQPGRPIRTSAPHRPSFTELTLAVMGDITPSRSSSYTVASGTTLVPETLLQAPTPAVGALASVRQQLRPWLGYRLTAAYSRPTFIDSYNPSNSTNQLGTYGSLHLTRTIYELSGTYVAQGPHRGRFTTSAEAGAGVLAIQSVDTTDYPTTNVHSFRPIAIVGVGTELALTRHWGVRAEYRALLYKPPAFASAVGESVPAGPLIFSSQPILGITYRFGANGKD